jgi:inosine-uridine nucleoside N-ribohydrolase
VTTVDVWIDTDPAAGLYERDVDDALALVQAFRSPEVRVHGVSVVFGNASLVDAVPIARDLVERFGPRNLPVVAGAAAREQLGTDTAATRALADALVAQPLTVLALGPATNVATMLLRRPELATRITRLIVVAGRRPGQRFLSSPTQREPFPDFNLECDPAAIEVVLAAGVPLTLAGWEVALHVWIRAADLERLRESGGPDGFGAWLAPRAASWLGLWRREVGIDGFNPFDTLAIAAVTHPQLIATMPVSVALVAAADGTPELLADPAATGSRRAIYCCKPDAELEPILLARLA